MKLYHGSSSRDIVQFDLSHGRTAVDYGKGVYFTSNFEQAKEWSCRNSSEGAVYECDIDLSPFKGFNFGANNEDVYYYIYLCRLELEDIVPDSVDGAEDVDYVQGVMLDGKIRDFEEIAERFNEGDLSFEEFKNAISFFEEKNQTCIKSDRAISEINANITVVHFTKKYGKSVQIENTITR